MESHRRERVALVGTGLAGLVSAYLLQNDPRQRYLVKVFESGPSLSLDAASISIPNAAQTSSDRVDLPMRAFAGGYYHNLKALYDYLGVRYRSQPFLFQFSQSSPYFVHASNLHQLAPRPSEMGMIRYLVEVMYLLACYSWFSICCSFVAPRLGDTLQQYLDRTRMPQRFVTYYVLPLLSSVTTCPHKALLDFPASDLIQYKRRTHGAPHYTVSEGVKGVQDRLTRGIQFVMDATITAIQPSEKGVEVSWMQDRGPGCETHTERFDRVILAVAPDVVGRVFKPLEHHMQRIPTAVVESVVHTDRSVLGEETTAATDRHGAQLIRLRTSIDTSERTESHHVQPCGAIVTTCPFSPIDPALILHSARFTRVLRSPESQRIVNAIFEKDQQSMAIEKSVPLWKNGDDNVYLVGGWCWDGMVLLEGCVVSAIRVAGALGVEVPWRHQQSKVSE